MIFSSLKSGLAHVRSNLRLLGVYYLCNLFFGLLLAAPLRFSLGKFVGNSEMGGRLGGLLDMDFLFEFFKQNQNTFSALTGLLLVIPAVYWLINLFLSGGTFAIFAHGEKYSPAFFWGNAAKYFGRFVRLTLWGMLVAGVLFCTQYLENGVRLLIWGKDAYQNIEYWGGWIRRGLLGASMGVFLMIFDYARLYTVLHEESRTRVSIWQGLKFSFRNFFSTAGLALLFFAGGGVLLFIYNPIANSLNAPNGVIVFLLLLWQQAYMIGRMLLRLAVYASEIDLYQRLTTQPQPVPEAPANEDFSARGLSWATE